MDLKSTVSKLISKADDNIYFIHRTVIALPYIDVSNGKTYTQKDLDESGLDNDYIEQYIYCLSNFENLWEDHKLDIAANHQWILTEEQYQEVISRNFQEQIKSFFEHGIYSVETSIERTATSLEEGQNHQTHSQKEQCAELEEILMKTGFGMNTSESNELLGALSNREELNTLLILEIPRECFGDLGEIRPLFQKSDDPFEVITAYRGLQTINHVIPTEYIKGGFYTKGKEIIFADNENYKSGYLQESGIYDSEAIKNILDELVQQENIEYDDIEKILRITQSEFLLDSSAAQIRGRIKFIEEKLLCKLTDIVQTEQLQKMIEQIMNEIKNPLEKISSEIEQSDFTNMMPDDIMSMINELLESGSTILTDAKIQRNWNIFYKMFPLYEKSLQKLDTDALKQLYSSYMANDAIALIKGKLKDIVEFNEVLNELGPLDEANILGELEESDREKYEVLSQKLELQRDKVCENPLKKKEKHDYNIESSLQAIASKTSLQDVKTVQAELKEGYLEIENPTETKDNSQSLVD